MNADDLKITALATINISGAAVTTFVVRLEPYLSVALLLVQIAVGVASLVYAIRKFRNNKKDKQ
jgi:hypothetical protein